MTPCLFLFYSLFIQSLYLFKTFLDIIHSSKSMLPEVLLGNITPSVIFLNIHSYYLYASMEHTFTSATSTRLAHLQGFDAVT